MSRRRGDLQSLAAARVLLLGWHGGAAAARVLDAHALRSAPLCIMEAQHHEAVTAAHDLDRHPLIFVLVLLTRRAVTATPVRMSPHVKGSSIIGGSPP